MSGASRSGPIEASDRQAAGGRRAVPDPTASSHGPCTARSAGLVRPGRSRPESARGSGGRPLGRRSVRRRGGAIPRPGRALRRGRERHASARHRPRGGLGLAARLLGSARGARSRSRRRHGTGARAVRRSVAGGAGARGRHRADPAAERRARGRVWAGLRERAFPRRASLDRGAVPGRRRAIRLDGALRPGRPVGVHGVLLGPRLGPRRMARQPPRSAGADHRGGAAAGGDGPGPGVHRLRLGQPLLCLVRDAALSGAGPRRPAWPDPADGGGGRHPRARRDAPAPGLGCGRARPPRGGPGALGRRPRGAAARARRARDTAGAAQRDPGPQMGSRMARRLPAPRSRRDGRARRAPRRAGPRRLARVGRHLSAPRRGALSAVRRAAGAGGRRGGGRRRPRGDRPQPRGRAGAAPTTASS